MKGPPSLPGRMKRTPIGRLMVYALGSLFLALLLVGVTGEVALRTAHNRFEGGGNEAIHEIRGVTKVRNLLTDARGLTPLIARDDAGALTRFEGLSRALDSSLESLDLDLPTEIALASSAKAHWETAELVVSELWLGERFRPNAYRGHIVGAIGEMRSLSNQVLDDLHSDIEIVDAQTHVTEYTFLAVFLLGLTGAFIFSRMFRRATTVPLRRLKEAAAQFGMDNLDYRIEVERDDELGALADAFNTMASRLQQSRQALVHQAFHDSLTGLPNRALFRDRAEHALMRAKRHDDTIAVLFVDLDDFKHVNDSYGHSSGDELILQVADRLRSVMRAEDTIARFGGDEFAVLLEDVDPDSRAAVDSAERILTALEAPISLSEMEISVRASIGIYTCTSSLDDADEALRRADVAMYAAKAEGKSRYREFEMSMHEALSERARLEADLARALAEGELDVHFQPIVSFETDEALGAEALLRWKHPVLGMVPPNRFIPVAEQTGQIVPIGRMVLERAAALAAGFKVRDGMARCVMVNLSVRQLQHPRFVEELKEILAASQCDPTRLALEITESMLVTDVDNTVRTLRAIRALGVKIAVDDFGTGYSSLAYLKRFPLDILKIDKTFIDGIAGPATQEAALARSIITLAQHMNLKTVAEGIEHSEQASRLREMGCDCGQGFLFSRPVPEPDLQAAFARLSSEELV
jgi:diguanylate cyclase (GGDEF)-like protein